MRPRSLHRRTISTVFGVTSGCNAGYALLSLWIHIDSCRNITNVSFRCWSSESSPFLCRELQQDPGIWGKWRIAFRLVLLLQLTNITHWLGQVKIVPLRFFQQTHAKRQTVLQSCFRSLGKQQNCTTGSDQSGANLIPWLSFDGSLDCWCPFVITFVLVLSQSLQTALLGCKTDCLQFYG